MTAHAPPLNTTASAPWLAFADLYARHARRTGDPADAAHAAEVGRVAETLRAWEGRGEEPRPRVGDCPGRNLAGRGPPPHAARPGDGPAERAQAAVVRLRLLPPCL